MNYIMDLSNSSYMKKCYKPKDYKHYMQAIKSEFFTINVNSLPALYAYKLIVGNNDGYIINSIAGKLTSSFDKEFKAIFGWDKTSKLLVSDKNISDDYLQKFMLKIWSEQKVGELKGISNLGNINGLEKNQINSLISEYASSNLKKIYKNDIVNHLKQFASNAGKVDNNLIYDIRPWVINNMASLSITIKFRMTYNSDLKCYYDNENKDIKNMQVITINSFTEYANSSGNIVDVYGNNKNEGKRLLAITKNNSMKRIIEKSIKNYPDDPVVSVEYRNRKHYDYVMSSLKPVITSSTKLNGIKYSDILNRMKILPEKRYEIISGIYKIISKSGFVGKNIDDNEKIFNNINKEYIEPTIILGNNTEIKYKEYFINGIKKYGLYKRNEKFENNIMKIYVINNSRNDITEGIKQILDGLKKVNVNAEIINMSESDNISDLIPEMENKIDIAIVISENNPPNKYYFDVKAKLIAHQIQSQNIEYKTLSNSYAYSNIVLGILAKTGNIPFILKDTSYCDYVVGMDIAREKKQKLSGTRNIGAMTSLYLSDGEMINYKIIHESLDGETMPDNMLEKMYNDTKFRGKKVIFHRDGLFRGNELNRLKNIAESLNSEFGFIEIIKRNTPRIYLLVDDKIINPPVGTCMKIDDTEYILITSSSPKGTVRPIRIKLYNISFDDAVRSIYNLMCLDYGSIRKPKIPVTIHYSDKIAGLALHSVIPGNLEGSIPFWL